jgi:hypothetical protein
MAAVAWWAEGCTSRGLIIPLIIQTIRLDPSGPDAIDGLSHLSRPDPSGTDQIDADHQPTDLVHESSPTAGTCYGLGGAALNAWLDVVARSFQADQEGKRCWFFFAFADRLTGQLKPSVG